MAVVSKEHISIRVSTKVLEGVTAFAESHALSRSAAVEEILTRGLEQPEAQEVASSELDTLRDYVATLKNQITVKDQQIENLSQLIDQAQQIQGRITMALPVTQQNTEQDERSQTNYSQDGRTAQQETHSSSETPAQGAEQVTTPQNTTQAKKKSFWARLWD